MIGVLLICSPLFSHADNDSSEIPLQTILDIGLHLAVLSKDIDNAKALVEMGADANSLSKIWNGPFKMMPSEVAFTYYQRDEANTIEIQKETLFERLQQLGIHLRPFNLRSWNQWLSSIPLGDIYIENIERANHDWLSFQRGKPLEHAIYHGNFAMVELLYPITRKEKSQFPFYRMSEEEYLSFSLRAPQSLIYIGMEHVYYSIANLLIEDMLSRDIKITSQTLAELNFTSDHFEWRIESLYRRLKVKAGFLGIIKEGISDVFSILWNEHPLVNDSLQYGLYAEQFFKRLPKAFAKADEKLNELRAFDRERAVVLSFKNLIDKAVKKFGIQPIEPQCQAGERHTTTTGAVFTCDRSHAELGEAWRDPDGLVWGDIVKKTDGAVHYMDSYNALSYCTSIGARLPSREEFLRLREYMKDRRGAEFLFFERYIAKILPNLSGYWFWSSTVNPSFSNSAYYFNGFMGGIYYGSRSDDYAVRCVVDH